MTCSLPPFFVLHSSDRDQCPALDHKAREVDERDIKSWSSIIMYLVDGYNNIAAVTEYTNIRAILEKARTAGSFFSFLRSVIFIMNSKRSIFNVQSPSVSLRQNALESYPGFSCLLKMSLTAT